MTTRVLTFVLLLLSFAICVRAERGRVSRDGPQQNANQHLPERDKALSRILGSRTISPHQLAEYTNQRDEYEVEFVDFKPIWRRLQVPRDRDGDFDGFDPSSTRWRAEVIDASNPQLKLVKAIVKISAYGGADRRYLVFAKDEAESGVERWRFTGNIDFLHNYEASKETQYHRVESDSKHVWLVLRTAPRIGTGISASDERWYQIDTEPPREVLRYPLQGGRVMGELCDLEYKGSVPGSKFVDGRLTQAVRYKVSFGAAHNPSSRWLFAKRAQVNFVWDENGNNFVIDKLTSSVSAEEINTTFGSADEERFIEYNFRQFVRLAGGARAEQRTWLKSVIEKILDGSKKAALIQALKQ